jgi:hypothetical protein
MQGFAYLAGCEKVWGGPGDVGASSLDLPPSLACEFDGALVGGFRLLPELHHEMPRVNPEPPLCSHSGGGLCCVGPS